MRKAFSIKFHFTITTSIKWNFFFATLRGVSLMSSDDDDQARRVSIMRREGERAQSKIKYCMSHNKERGIFAGNTNHPPHGPVKQFSFLQPVLDNKVKKSR